MQPQHCDDEVKVTYELFASYEPLLIYLVMILMRFELVLMMELMKIVRVDDDLLGVDGL